MNLKKWTYDTFPISPSAFPFLASAWVNPRVSASSVQSVFHRIPSAFICVHLRLIFVSLSDRTQDIQNKLFPKINENGLTESPQSTQRAQSSAIPVTTDDKAAASRIRTRMTRIARIFTDTRAFALEKPQRTLRTQRKRQRSVLSECSVVLDSLFLPAIRKAV